MCIVLSARRWFALRQKLALTVVKKVKLKEKCVELVVLMEYFLHIIRKEVYGI